MKGWEQRKLKDICQIKGGKRLPLGEDFSEKGYPYIRARDIKGGKIYIQSPVYVSDQVREKIVKYITNKDDILITIVGANIGDVGIVPAELDNASLTENAVKLTNYIGVHPQYLLNFLNTSYCKEVMQRASAGAAQGKLGIYKINEIIISLPPLLIQQKIAAVLSSYDDLIENNNRRISILEKMADELYREWFVRLRFPGHEKVKIAKGVPEGWEIRKLRDILELAYGKAMKEETRITGMIPVYGSSGLIGYHNQYLVLGPGLIVGRKGNVGNIIRVKENFYPIDTTYYVISSYPLTYLFYLLHTMNFINNDSAVPGLNREQAYANEFYFPTLKLINAFEKQIAPILSQKEILENQNTNLTIARERLLSRLMSGKIDMENLDIEFSKSIQEEIANG